MEQHSVCLLPFLRSRRVFAALSARSHHSDIGQHEKKRSVLAVSGNTVAGRRQGDANWFLDPYTLTILREELERPKGLGVFQRANLINTHLQQNSEQLRATQRRLAK
jgi:hypothetical protein